MKIEVGQKWEVYSRLLRRWASAEVREISDRAVILAYDEFPETLSTDQHSLTNQPQLFRLAVAG